jgi:hypothetical protein
MMPLICQNRYFDMFSSFTRWNRFVIILLISVHINMLVSNNVEPFPVENSLFNDTVFEIANTLTVPLFENNNEINSNNISMNHDEETFDDYNLFGEVNGFIIAPFSKKVITDKTATDAVLDATETTTKETSFTITTTTGKPTTTIITEPIIKPSIEPIITTGIEPIIKTSKEPIIKSTTEQIELKITLAEKNTTSLTNDYTIKNTESINSTEIFVNKLYPSSKNIHNYTYIR